MVGTAFPQSGNPPFRCIRPTGLFDARLDQPDLRFRPHQLCHPHQGSVIGKPGVVVEEEQEFSVDVGNTCIPASGDTEVLRQPELLDLVRDAFRLPAIADTDDVEVDAFLCQQGLESAIEVFKSFALAEDDDPEGIAPIVFEALKETPL